MKFKSIADAKRQTGLSYMGMVNPSAKHMKNAKLDEMVYALYLAPASLSGYNVCPKSNAECRMLCLHESGQNRIDLGTITNARVKKTKLFFEDREFFMQWLITDIQRNLDNVKKKGQHFSVRLNNTSDLSPEQFYIDHNEDKVNVLELFPEVQFYDYTKVDKRVLLLDKYPNYDLTFSYDGYNWDVCEKMLARGVRVAVVFAKDVPQEWRGYRVINGDQYDVRFRDEKDVIVGLKFKTVKNDYTTDMKFVVQ